MNTFKEVIIPKGSKFTQKMLIDLDYNNINPAKWTTDKEKK